MKYELGSSKHVHKVDHCCGLGKDRVRYSSREASSMDAYDQSLKETLLGFQETTDPVLMLSSFSSSFSTSYSLLTRNNYLPGKYYSFVCVCVILCVYMFFLPTRKHNTDVFSNLFFSLNVPAVSSF